MRRVGHLFERVIAFDNLAAAAREALKGKLDRPSAARFFLNLEKEIFSIQEELAADAYRPRPYHCFQIREPKCRHICAAAMRDRVVHHALCNALAPALERGFIHDSYACRKGKGQHVAVRRAQAFSRKSAYFLKTDVEKFFASIDHEVLKALLARKIKDARLLRLMARIIHHPVPDHAPGKGLAIGNLTSQWWANLYLDALDHYIKDVLGIRRYIRYMDDVVAFADTKDRLHHLRSEISAFLRDRLLLELKESATHIAPVRQGIPFLGVRVFPGLIRLQRRGRTRFLRKLRQRERTWRTGRLDEATFLRSAAGLFGHIRHANTWRMRRKIFYGLG